MSTIKINVVDQAVTFESSPAIFSGDINVDVTQFTFNEAWTGFTKTAVFYREIETPYLQVLNDDQCYIPHEVTPSAGRMYIGVFGVKDDKVITSEVVYYDIGTGVLTVGTPSNPSPDIWQQIINQYQEIKELAEKLSQQEKDFVAQLQKSFNDYTTKTDKVISDFKTESNKNFNDFKNQANSDFQKYYQELKEISANFMSLDDVDRICDGTYDPIYDEYNVQTMTEEEILAILV